MLDENNFVSSALMEAERIVSHTHPDGCIPDAVIRFFQELDLTIGEIEKFMDEPSNDKLEEIAEIIRKPKTEKGVPAPDDQRHQ